MAEGLYSIANVLSFTRILFLLPVNQHLGPLQISLGNMLSVNSHSLVFYLINSCIAISFLIFFKDILKFLSIFLIIFMGFTIGLNNLFWYYQKDTKNLVNVGNVSDFVSNTRAEENFGSYIDFINISLVNFFIYILLILEY